MGDPWRQTVCEHGWIAPEWAAPANVRALVTTRGGGVSLPPYAGLNLGLHVGDDGIAVRRNREIVSALLPGVPCWLDQVHGTDVADADAPRVIEPVCADAAIARRPASVCVVMTADCLPVLLCDTAGSVVAAVHAGWRGLAAGVLEAALERMRCVPASVMAWLGPAIGPTHFEVGDEVRARFVAADAAAASAFVPGHARGKWMADLYALARLRLAAAGVTQVTGGTLCTYADQARFYSYRRDGVTGRFASLIWRVS
ncbi:MAG: peptidoglycan editing factor PgeF [Rhodocyclales bacterium]|nr:peptidoglycan editing factor PgeF [Rhodocyclales bacterium]